MEVVILCGMSDDKVYAEFLPVASLEEIEKIYLIRRQPFNLNLPKLISYSPPSIIRRSLLLSELYRIVILIYLCIFKNKVHVLIGVYFVPHGLYAGIVGKLFGKRVIQYLIGTDRPKVMKVKVFLRILGWAQFIGVRGKTSQKQLSDLGVSPAKFFIPIGVNAIDFNRFSPSESIKQYDLIYTGRIDFNKQVLKLIQAIARLVFCFPNLHVAIIGDGPERQKLEEHIKRLNLSETVIFLGNQPYVEIPIYLRKARIFMMASEFEGLPVAMLEALSCGLPVVVPNVGDITDIAEHGVNSWVVDPPTVENYVEAFNGLLSDHSLYLHLVDGAISTREKFLVDFSIDKAKHIWHTVLNY